MVRYNACCGAELALRTGFVDLYDTAVGDFLQQSQQGRLVVSYSRVLVLSADVSNANGLSGESAANKTLSEVLAAAKVQHHVRLPYYCMHKCRTAK